jgi:hypothetical protein
MPRKPGLPLIASRRIIVRLTALLAWLAMSAPQARGADYVTGYNYKSSVKVKSVMVKLLPGGQAEFELVVRDKTYRLEAGKRFFFKQDFPDGVDAFTIRGINLSERLDPNNKMAFPTAITFMQDGVAPILEMNPIAKKSSVLTSPWLWATIATLLLLGGALFVVWRRHKQAA